MPKKPYSPVSQNLKRYNRESGKKTLVFVGVLITLILIFTILTFFLIEKPKVLTSSVQTESSSILQK